MGDHQPAQSFKERIEANPIRWLLGAFFAGLTACGSALTFYLTTFDYKVVSTFQIEQWRATAEQPHANGPLRGGAPIDPATVRRIDAELTQRFDVFLDNLWKVQFNLQFSDRQQRSAEWSHLRAVLFSSPEQSGATNNVFPEFRSHDVKQLLEYRLSASQSSGEQLEMERALREVAILEREMEVYDSSVDQGTVAQRSLELITRNPAFRRWVELEF